MLIFSIGLFNSDYIGVPLIEDKITCAEYKETARVFPGNPMHIQFSVTCGHNLKVLLKYCSVNIYILSPISTLSPRNHEKWPFRIVLK